MSIFLCKHHRVTLTITEQGGRPFRVLRVDPTRVEEWPSACALTRMREPRAIERGALYTNGSTGRNAFSACTIEEV